jgi:hypothetical protein
MPKGLQGQKRIANAIGAAIMVAILGPFLAISHPSLTGPSHAIECPLWVKSGHQPVSALRQKRTFACVGVFMN